MMDSELYIKWKQWRPEGFASIGPGTEFYLSQVLGKYLMAEGVSLEIGFGNGSLMAYLQSRGYDVIGSETNSQLVETARASGFEAYEGNVWDVAELENRKFDLVVGFDVAEHMEFDDLVHLFCWCRAHLAPKGLMCLRFPEGASPLGLANQNGDFTHVTALTLTKMKALCEAADLKLLSYSDDILSSNALCRRGIFGRGLLRSLQWYSSFLKKLSKWLLYPVAPALSLATNSIAFIGVAGDD